MSIENLLDRETIKSQLDDYCLNVLKSLILLETIDSTNSYMLMFCDREGRIPAACFAEEQTHGRGRRGKRWHSPYGQNIYLSIAWDFSRPMADLGGVSLAIALGVVRAVRGLGAENAVVKWPNDVLVHGRKLAGVLIESAKSKGKSRLVIGIGLNYKMTGVSIDNIQQPWCGICDLLMDSDNTLRSRLAGNLLANCMRVCQQYDKNGLGSFQGEWRQHDICDGRLVRLYNEQIDVCGVVLGLTPQGGLRLNVEGQERVFYAGDVSLKV